MTAFVGGALLVAVTGLLLREFGFRGAPAVAALGGVVLLLSLSERIGDLASEILGVSDAAGLSESTAAVLKIVGIGYLSGIAAETCETLGAPSASRAVKLCARLEILAVALPYFLSVLGAGIDLLGG